MFWQYLTLFFVVAPLVCFAIGLMIYFVITDIVERREPKTVFDLIKEDWKSNNQKKSIIEYVPFPILHQTKCAFWAKNKCSCGYQPNAYLN